MNRTSPTCLASGGSEQVLCRVLAALAKSCRELSSAQLPLGAVQHCHLGAQSPWPHSQCPEPLFRTQVMPPSSRLVVMVGTAALV